MKASNVFKKTLFLAFAPVVPVLCAALIFANPADEKKADTEKTQDVKSANASENAVKPIAEKTVDLTPKLSNRGKLPEYYLGVLCLPVPEVFASHLGLDGYGLLVEALAPGGPADKAGVEIGDIVLTFAGKNVVGVEDFFVTLEADKDKEQPITVLHKGKKEEKTIKPEKRPEVSPNLQGPASGMIRNIRPGIIFEGKDGVDPRHIIRKFVEQIDENGANIEFLEESEPIGVHEDPSAMKTERLQVSVLPGDKPGTQKIHVRVNDEVWNVDKIEELPAELQPMVQRAITPMKGIMLAAPNVGFESGLVKEWNNMRSDIRSEMDRLETDVEKAYENMPELKEKMQSFRKNIENKFEKFFQHKTDKSETPVHDAGVNKVS